MSEAQTKVEEPVVVAPVETTPAVVEPVVEAPAAVEPATDAPVTEAVEATEPVVEASPEEVKPVEEGILGYKGPGLLKGFMFQKKFFWIGSEAVEHKALTSYLRGEKLQDVANKNAAWAAHTGKGLLFFSKKASEKATPAGLFNLSEVSEINEEGTLAFFFTAGAHKHTFEASTIAERNGWVMALKAAATEAKELASTVTETEEYKKAHSELVPAAAAVAVPAKAAEKDIKVEDKKEDKVVDKKEEMKARKSRSASRKRNSIFGGFMGKKDEKTTEVAKDETPVVAAEETAETSAAIAEPVVEAPVTEAVPEITETAPVVEPTPVVEKPAASKRNSIFDTLKSQFSNKGEKKTEEAPAVPAKEEPVSETAPVIPAVEASEPMTSVEAPVVPAAEVAEAPAAVAEPKVETPVVKSEKRKASLPFFNKKKDTTSGDEGTSEKPFFAKLRDTVKGKKSEKVSEKPAATEAAAADETPAVVEPAVVSEPTPVVPSATPQVAASA